MHNFYSYIQLYLLRKEQDEKKMSWVSLFKKQGKLHILGTYTICMKYHKLLYKALPSIRLYI